MISQLLISDNEKSIDDYLKEKILKKGDLFFEIIPENKQYSINQIKEVARNIVISNPSKRVYLLRNFYQSSLEAQNSFLKILEEPPERVLFVLTTNNVNNLIPTIVSRTIIVNLSKKNHPKINFSINNLLEKLITRKSLDFLGEKQFTVVNKERAMNIVDEIIIYFKERLSFDKKAGIILKKTLKLKSLLERNNLNPQLTIDSILIFIWKTYMLN